MSGLIIDMKQRTASARLPPGQKIPSWLTRGILFRRYPSHSPGPLQGRIKRKTERCLSDAERYLMKIKRLETEPVRIVVFALGARFNRLVLIFE